MEYCGTGKIIYHTRTKAQEVARLHKRGKSGLYAYQCNVCQKYHLTTANKKKRRRKWRK